jgi:hypothetical protein
MTRIALIIALVFTAYHTAAAQAPAYLEKPFAIIMRTYPHVDARRAPLPPADSVWLFRGNTGSVGSAEVAFQGDQVVYMVFRRGVGGVSWKQHEIDALHDIYCEDLLHESPCGKRYNSFLAAQINAAIIARKDFDAKALLSGM